MGGNLRIGDPNGSRARRLPGARVSEQGAKREHGREPVVLAFVPCSLTQPRFARREPTP